MSFFSDIKIDETAKVSEDRVGGGSSRVDATGCYDLIIKKAYLEEAKSGAVSFVLDLETEDGRSLRVQEWFTNRDKESFYIDRNTGEKQFLPGFNKLRAIDFLITGEISPYPKAEEKTIKLYDYDARAELPTQRQVLTGWWGKMISVLAVKTLNNKQSKNESGNYVPTAETYEKMEIDHFIDPKTKRTRNEITAGKVEPEIHNKWVETFPADYVKDRREIKEDAPTGSSSGSSGNSSVASQSQAAEIFG